MSFQENTTISTLSEQKETFKSAYREEWQEAYISWIHRRIAEKVSDTLDFINALPHRSPASWDEDILEDIHSRRRIIAGYLQEAELCCFDEGIYAQVEQDKMFILKGAWCVVRFLLPSTHAEVHMLVSIYCSSNERIIFKAMHTVAFLIHRARSSRFVVQARSFLKFAVVAYIPPPILPS